MGAEKSPVSGVGIFLTLFFCQTPTGSPDVQTRSKGAEESRGRSGGADPRRVARRLRLADEAAIDHVANLARRRQTKTVLDFAPLALAPRTLRGSYPDLPLMLPDPVWLGLGQH